MGLHEVDGAVCAGDVVGQVGADRGSDELAPVFPECDLRIEFVDDGIAEGAVEVEVEFDFWPGGLGSCGQGDQEKGEDDFWCHAQN